MNEIKLTPSKNGEKCIGNGKHPGIEIQCDECDFFLVCFPEWDKNGAAWKRQSLLFDEEE